MLENLCRLRGPTQFSLSVFPFNVNASDVHSMLQVS